MNTQAIHKHSIRLRMISLCMSVLLTIPLCLSGCFGKDESRYQKNTKLNTSESVRLVIAGTWTSLPGMDILTQKFHEVYPNCTVEYEYLQDLSKTLSLRITSDDDRVDLFTTGNILKDSENREYALDLLEHQEEVPLTDTFPGFVNNYKFTDDDEIQHQYAVPLGGEVRGLYVNKTLLSNLGIDVPTTRSELLAACEKISEAGYIPFQDNPSSFGQLMLFPYIANLASDNRESIASCDENAAEIFREPLEFLYNLTVDNYYNYKYIETEYGRFTDLSNEARARYFLNIAEKDSTYEKIDDIGEIAFMPSADYLKTTIDKIKEDYHSNIEYEFIITPVTESGGYAYLSPHNGLAVNKNSKHTDWALEFMNFFFTEENNKTFAEASNRQPNTKDVLDVVSKKYSIPAKNIGQPEYVTFEGFNFYNLIVPTLVTTAKANNPKYMQEDGTMYPFEYYLNQLKEVFAEQKKALKE